MWIFSSFPQDNNQNLAPYPTGDEYSSSCKEYNNFRALTSPGTDGSRKTPGRVQQLIKKVLKNNIDMSHNLELTNFYYLCPIAFIILRSPCETHRFHISSLLYQYQEYRIHWAILWMKHSVIFRFEILLQIFPYQYFSGSKISVRGDQNLQNFSLIFHKNI